jgi:SAM-dependent methyltransferase
MERLTRKPFQGVTNIIRFNWHFYVIAFVFVAALFVTKRFLPANLNIAATILALLAILGTAISLTVSYYVYDCSNLYSLDWLNNLAIGSGKQLVNINAGFDETSWLLTNKYSDSQLTVFDFYDSEKHTEVSIERARKVYATFPGTKTISTNAIPLEENSTDYIFLILAAHEIRNDEERILFFRQLKNALRTDGKIILVEHLRDFNNFFAYNFGFFHFISRNTWKQTITQAGLSIETEIKITPFISTFILGKNGATA